MKVTCWAWVNFGLLGVCNHKHEGVPGPQRQEICRDWTLKFPTWKDRPLKLHMVYYDFLCFCWFNWNWDKHHEQNPPHSERASSTYRSKRNSTRIATSVVCVWIWPRPPPPLHKFKYRVNCHLVILNLDDKMPKSCQVILGGFFASKVTLSVVTVGHATPYQTPSTRTITSRIAG